MKRSFGQVFFYSLVCVVLLFVPLNAQTVNIDFESTAPGTYTASNAVNGWTLSSHSNTTGPCTDNSSWNPGASQFSIVSTPIVSFPTIGNVPNSPLGGTNVAKLNDFSSGGVGTKLSRSFFVSTANMQFQLAVAGVWQDGGHSCCAQAGYKILIRDASGNELTCMTHSLSAQGSSCIGSAMGVYSVSSSGETWFNWQVKTINLTPFTGSVVTLEIMTFNCNAGSHYGVMLVDASISSYYDGVNYCSGSNLATVFAPPGFTSYQWYAPGTGIIPQATLSTLTVPNPVLASTYSVYLGVPSGCQFVATYPVTFSTLSITSVDTYSSCFNGSSGAATVNAIGSGTGYTYTWTNSSSSVISTSSVISNVPPGSYTVKVGGSGAPGCGTSTSIATVGVANYSLITLLKPFCGTTAYLSAPGGTNYQWYTSTSSAISASLGGAASSYTVTSPITGAIYIVAFNGSGGCRDSIKYTLASSPPGSLSITSNPLACANATNAAVAFSLVPATTSSGPNSFSVSSTGTTSVYSSSMSGASNTFTSTSLSAGGTYSISAFDGSCSYALSFSVTPFHVDFTVSPSSSTLCPGNSAAASINFSSVPAQGLFTYSWTPSTYLLSSSNAVTIVNPTYTPGIVSTIVYTAIVTPSFVNCPTSKTMAITIADPVTPTITSIPNFCTNSPSYTILASPPGGYYINVTTASIGTLSGIISPSLATIGINTFSYVNSIGSCSAGTSSSFMVNSGPVITVSGNTTICEGQNTTLLASGATTYTWSNPPSSSPFINSSPSVTTIYTVSGTSLNTNCSTTSTVEVLVASYPTLAINGNTYICLGESTTLTASGASSYNWNNGPGSAINIVSPLAATIYTVTGTGILPSCVSTQTVMVNVHSCITGISELIVPGSLQVYPNPGKGKFFVDTGCECQLKVYDLTGKLLIESASKTGHRELDLSIYQNGVYFLNISGTEISRTIRLIKLDD